jgi:hypothetical protein
MKEKTFHTRGFISLLTLGSFVVMTLNGIVLYFAPQGQIAYWVDWRFLALTREAWSDMHVVSSILFAVAGAIHLVYNWTPMVNYIAKKISGARKLRKELVLATALSLFVVFGPVYQVFPLNYIIDLGSYFKESWIVSRDIDPFGRRGDFLEVFAKMNIDFDKDGQAGQGSR